jgi:hypothetical protein
MKNERDHQRRSCIPLISIVQAAYEVVNELGLERLVSGRQKLFAYCHFCLWTSRLNCCENLA